MKTHTRFVSTLTLSLSLLLPVQAVHADFRKVQDSGNGDDTLIGTNAKDELLGGAGDDILVGAGGDDNLWGDADGSFVYPDWQAIREVNQLSDYTQYSIKYNNRTGEIETAGSNDNMLGGAGDDWMMGVASNDNDWRLVA